MATAPELTVSQAALTERVDNHIKFFWAAFMACGSILATICYILFSISGRLGGIERIQSDSTSKIVSELLAHPPSTSRSEVAGELTAASVILGRAKIGKPTPDKSIVSNVAGRLIDDQETYADMPEVWKTTGAFINYKFAAYLLDSVKNDLGKAYSLNCGSISQSKLGTTFDHCNLDLEGISAMDANFQKCVIRYHGGAVHIKEMHFFDCVFEVRVSSIPEAGGVAVMKQLARAIDTSRVDVST